MLYQHEWVKVRESAPMCAAIVETVAFTNLAEMDITKQKKKKARHMFQSVTWLILRK